MNVFEFVADDREGGERGSGETSIKETLDDRKTITTPPNDPQSIKEAEDDQSHSQLVMQQCLSVVRDFDKSVSALIASEKIIVQIVRYRYLAIYTLKSSTLFQKIFSRTIEYDMID
jgi:hypothetical protein